MPGTTSPDNIRHPVVGDNLTPLATWFANLAADVQTAITSLRSSVAANLATHANRQAERVATGRVTRTGGLAHQQGAGLTITFPAGRFSQPPVVILTTNRSRIGTAVHAVSTTSANLYIENWSGGAETTDIVVSWAAFQMTTANAIG